MFNIKSPEDIKKLTMRELDVLAKEIREKIVYAVSANGGHLASNLGVVELSIALHRVFNSPTDKIIWDVGHQCYAHKILTGREDLFSSLRRQNGLAGFPKNSESPHDPFNTGHASTSISAALGILAADRMKKGKANVIAVIGDGALTGGMAYEALSHAGHLKLPLIVILNDNKMSISRNVGGLSKYLSRLSMKAKYQTFRRHFDAMTKKIPYFGEAFFDWIVRLKRAVKAVFYIDNFFVDLGFEYVGPINGHNINALKSVFEDVRKLNRPVVIHAVTQKGKGYGYAEEDPGNYHGVGSFPIDGGIEKKEEHAADLQRKKTFTECFASCLLESAGKDKLITAVTAAMKTGTGLTAFAQKFPERFFDVGIAEEHAVTFAAGLAAAGLKPVVAMYSTFIQRSVDQVFHDTALQKLPVVFALDRAGFVSSDGETHQGLFDISLFRSAPNMTILCPASGIEMKLMLNWSLRNVECGMMKNDYSLDISHSALPTGPVIIRYPKAFCPHEDDAFSSPLVIGRGVFVSKTEGNDVCLAFTGSLYEEVQKAAKILKERGIKTDLYNLRCLKPVDEDYLINIINNYKLTVFIEEGKKEGSFAEYAASLAQLRNCKSKTAAITAESGFLEEDKALGTREELLAVNSLDGKGIAEKTAGFYKGEYYV